MKNADMPANPTKHNNDHFQHQNDYTTGLTKREHFAGLAMQGMLSSPKSHGTFEQFADSSVNFADALLKALEE